MTAFSGGVVLRSYILSGSHMGERLERGVKAHEEERRAPNSWAVVCSTPLRASTIYRWEGAALPLHQGNQCGGQGEEDGGQRGEASPTVAQTLTLGIPMRMGPLGPIKGMAGHLVGPPLGGSQFDGLLLNKNIFNVNSFN
jgi:hypothetical protein